MWSEEVEAIAYIKVDSVWDAMPSEHYLTACTMLLTESYGSLPAEHPSRRLDVMGVSAEG